MENRKLSMTLHNKQDIHNHYIPIFRSGGLFVETSQALKFGERVIVAVELLSETQRIQLPGNVAWITPAGAQGGQAQGVGIEFTGEHQGKLQQYFENVLGDLLHKAPSNPCY